MTDQFAPDPQRIPDDELADADGGIPLADDGELIVPKVERRSKIHDLVATIKEYADKLDSDGASRGDLKILSRTMRELRYAFKVFQPYRHRRKVTVFGSARTPSDDPTYEQALRFGQEMAAADWMVVTGAASGIMEAGHRGAGREHSMGLNIMLPFEQSANPVIAGDEKLVHMKYFFTRKLMFVKECDAICCLAGGFGTLDEGYEVLTLLQTGKRDMAPLVLLDAPGDDYWKRFQTFVTDVLLARGMISPADLHLYKVTDSCSAAVEEILGFFRNYHSMRYLKNRLVFRLQKAPSPELLEQIQDCFADLLVDGKFNLVEPHAHEDDETNLAEHARLAFHFNRRSLGRLRQLINVLNREEIRPEDTLPGE
jgi:uncharacterized protein (TIGR00730 family)